MTSGFGCVSRVSPVQTALRNCTRDEGGPFGFSDQELIPSYRKLLWSKAMVVNRSYSDDEADRKHHPGPMPTDLAASIASR
jgi:hypothetical protein